ncbi:dipeptidase [Solilutibacter silvestris]|uniref:Zn-dependent dipeptidase microsomal dipeptidase-like protein n=1 Tax=Solilutibacter silvestris TaxID=1645665 RepID=A0A2K1Q3J3_9GAMM|nr:dipeptidase [Lysobacter silvestris]PNS09609.1 Zn-dependent dipeptidase microsomal dipeptidase-like protein [Lysobacter silvestris]
MKPLRSLLALTLAALSGLATAQSTPAARKLAHDSIIVDTHIDGPEMLQDGWRDLGQRTDREFDWVKAQQGGLKIAFMSIYTSAKQDADNTAYQVANTMIDSIEALVQRHPNKFALLRSPRDVTRLGKPGIVLLPLGMENGAPIGGDLRKLQFFFDRGVRYITLAHSAANRIADSSYGVERKWHGLSPFGRDVVKEMNRLGIMVDVSHLSDESALEAIKLSSVPVVATHSGMRHFTPGFERNASDEVAKAIAAKGGVVQITFGTGFVNPKAASDMQDSFRAREDLRLRNLAAKAAGKPIEDESEFSARWEREHPTPKTDISAVIDQVVYAVKLVGIDHVGIGSDFDGVDGKLPTQLQSVADYPNLIAGLQAHDIKDGDIRKILGGNLLRVWTAVENGAKR